MACTWDAYTTAVEVLKDPSAVITIEVVLYHEPRVMVLRQALEVGLVAVIPKLHHPPESYKVR